MLKGKAINHQQKQMSILSDLEKFEEQYASLEPDKYTRQELLQQAQKLTDDFLREIDDIPAFNQDYNPDQSLVLNGKKQSIEQILSTYRSKVIDTGIVASSGGHVGYIPGGGIYVSSIADYIAAVSNEYTGVSYASPGGVAIENEVIDWLKNIFSYPQTAVGNLTSGGSIANLIALTAARDKHKIKNDIIGKSVIYLSQQAHHCLHKAIRIIGLEDIQLRMIELDSHSRMIAPDLENKIKIDKASGLNPFMIIASAGTTDTGAIDPLNEIANISSRHGLWLHVDAAYGGFFIMVESKKEALKGIEKSDSLVIDPHKGLFVPYGLGAVLVKDKLSVLHSHHYKANYMQDATQGQHVFSPADLSPELTKHFRGLRLWLPLKLYGTEPFVACLKHKLLLTEYFRQELEKVGFKLGPKPDLTVSYFWYPCESSLHNAFNKKLLQYIHQDGSVFLSSTLINRQFVIRMAILAFRTNTQTIDKAIVMIKAALNKCINDDHKLYS